MKIISFLVLLLFFIFVSIGAAWYQLHGDIVFSSDISRDFLLFQEITDKTFVLIGPRSSTGLFHGPLWLYLNYPAYSVGNGNPVIVGFWWVVLAGVFSYTTFLIAKRLFGKESAVLALLMISLYMAFHTRGFFNPHGAMFVLPSFFYTFIRYVETKKISLLLLHVLLAGIMIQFQMAVGLPFFLLSACAVIVTSIRSKTYRHIAALTFIALPLANFILFDLRHEFLLTNLVRSFISPSTQGSIFPYQELIGDRVRMLFSSVEFLRADPGNRNLVIFGIFIYFLYRQLREHKFRKIYFSFMYFYIGFFLLSFINKGNLLYFYLFPLFPLVFLIFCSFYTSSFRTVFLVLFFGLLAVNGATLWKDTRDARHFIGKDAESWKFLLHMAERLTSGPEKEFGYFVYSPDAFGYQPKYAMKYATKRSQKQITYFKKLPVTYIVSAPPPKDNPYMQPEWWRINQLKIAGEPSQSITYENGYRVDTFNLNTVQQEVGFDPSIDPGLHFR